MKSRKSIEVNKSTLKNSKRCNNEYLCEAEVWAPCGQINESISDMILHIESLDNEKMLYRCNYHLPFGGDHYCTCPARMYIYKEFGI